MATVHRLAQEESESARAECQPRMVALAQHLAQVGPLTIADSFRMGRRTGRNSGRASREGNFAPSLLLATTWLVEFEGRLVGGLETSGKVRRRVVLRTVREQSGLRLARTIARQKP